MSGLPPHNPDIKMIILGTVGIIWFLKLTTNGKFWPERIVCLNGCFPSLLLENRFEHVDGGWLMTKC